MHSLMNTFLSGCIAGALGTAAQVFVDELSRIYVPGRPRDNEAEGWLLRKGKPKDYSPSGPKVWAVSFLNRLQSGVVYGGLHGILRSYGYWGPRVEVFYVLMKGFGFAMRRIAETEAGKRPREWDVAEYMVQSVFVAVTGLFSAAWIMVDE
ncbi:hypothetical protein K440DRAFT_629788 [Wilcoxina mikolae CBS 423.85]|nr:hypothetical protein K440DRAFT_629788 [Wilcoxina mikolae CBS 423.85]